MDDHAYRRFWLRSHDSMILANLRATLHQCGLKEGTHFRFDSNSIHFLNPQTDLRDSTTRAYVNGALYAAKATPA